MHTQASRVRLLKWPHHQLAWLMIMMIALALAGFNLWSAFMIDMIFFVGVVLGLVHGAYDMVIISRATNHQPRYWLLLIASYGTLVVLITICYLQWPLATVITLLLLAAYHFGRFDLTTPHRLKGLWALCRGSWLIGLLLLAHWHTLTPLLTILLVQNPHTIAAFVPQHAHWLLATALIVALVNILGCLYFGRVLDMLEFLLVSALFYYTAPLVSFACYFIFCHSYRQLAQTAITGSLRWREIGAVAAACVGVIGIVIWLWLTYRAPQDATLLAQKIVLLALLILTVPHEGLQQYVKRLRMHANRNSNESVFID